MTMNHSVADSIIVESNVEISLGELSRACAVDAEWIISLVEEGILEPLDTSSKQWSFNSTSLRKIRVIQRLQRDLHVNLAGAALALQLLDEINELHTLLRVLESKHNEYSKVPR
jgi:chaperone modulatory protein CbpM